MATSAKAAPDVMGSSGAAREKTRDWPEGGVGPVPNLGDTVRETGASPHRSKGQRKCCSSPDAAHNKGKGRDTPKDAPARSLRGAAVGVIPPRLPRPRLSACEPSLTSPRTGSPAGMITERREPRRTPRPVLYSPAASPSRRALCARSWAASKSSRARNVGASGGALADGGGMGHRTG
jgi:hypothetical protein